MKQYVVLDFETALLDGSPSLDYYRKDFRAISCAFAWRDENGEIISRCIKGEEDINHFLGTFKNTVFIVHNYAFDEAVMICRFPEHVGRIKIDTMRLSQMADNGGKEYVLESEKTFDAILDELEGMRNISGLSLEACNSRLGDKKYYKHKEPYKKLMLDRGGSKRSFELLTEEELYEYNTLDAIVTLDLYEKVTELLTSRGIDWKMDHKLYRSVCKQTILSKCRGVCVDKVALDQHINLMASNLDACERDFKERFSKEIAEIEAEMLVLALSLKSTEAGKNKVRENPPKFNMGSKTQLERLYVGKLGIKPMFFTPTGRPSFSVKLLSQWGEAGKYLDNKGKYMIEKAQGEALKKLSEYDGKWHIDIKVAAARSGRLAGGNGE
jgi:hypothetical protein